MIEKIKSENVDNTPKTKIYFKRWVIIFIFSCISFLNAFNWIEHNIIQDVTEAFYNKSLPEDPTSRTNAINWFSIVYMICYIPLVFPAMFLLDRYGLRVSIIIGAFLTALGSIVKCFAVKPELFLVAMLGQFFCSVAQAFTLSVPARLSALWFAPEQVALATSIGVFGNQLGVAAGFLIPPVLVKLDSIEFMEKRFYYLYISVAVLTVVSFIAAIAFVQDQPILPPSLAQAEIRKNESNQTENNFQLFKKSIFALIKNGNFMLILISYGINVGAYYAISTLLNPIISEYYTDENTKIGLFGLIICLVGLVGSIIAGVVLDATKKYKLVTFIFYLGTLLSMLLFSITLNFNINIIFGTSTLLGFFMTGYLPVGFELAAEVTYPEPEGTSSGLLNTSAQVFGILFTYVQGIIISKYGAIYGNVFICILLLVGTVISGLVKSDLRRQRTLVCEKHLEGHDNNVMSINKDENID